MRTQHGVLQRKGTGMGSTGKAFIVASGHAHPDSVLTNADLEARVPGLAAGWIEQTLGIRERRVLRSHESLVPLARAALDGALERAGWDADSVDAVVCGVSFVDDALPATASLVASGRCNNAIAFDVNAACASWLYSLSVARSLMTTDPSWRRVAVLAAEHPTAWADYQDRNSCIFWGDSAACVLLDHEPGPARFELLDTAVTNENEHAYKVNVPRQSTFRHDGRYSYGQVLKLSDRCATEVLQRAGIEASELAAFVGHQSNPRLLKELGALIGVPWELQWHNVEWAGNQSAAGVATAFSDGWINDGDRLTTGDHVLLASVGGGYSGAAALLKWQA